MNDENPHRTFTTFSERSHWKGNSACGVNDEPDHIRLQPRWSNWPELDFAMPRQRYELDKIEQLMAKSYEQGKRDNRVKLAALLKQLIAL